MDEKTLKCYLAHIDKQVTDYQLYVDKVIQEQNKKIKELEKYLINTLDSHKKMIGDLDVALDELHSYAQALLNGGNA